jgi:leucyl aminopeptidase
MDVTDNPTLSPAGLSDAVRAKVMAPFPNQPTHQAEVNAIIAKMSKTNMKTYNDKLAAFNNRYYTQQTGKDAAEWIYSTFNANRNGRSDATVTKFEHTWLQPSIIGRIQGTGPHADEVVIVGAHEDSINQMGSTRRAPGADDDASGTCTVMELFRVLSTSGFKPDRTIEFHTYAAEEVGLRGSQAIATQYQKQGVPVYAMLQLDMTFYVKPGTKATFGVFTDYVNADLTRFLRLLVPTYSNLGFTNSACGYGCSDHASWYKAGYATCFGSEGTMANSDPYLHTESDIFQYLNLDHGFEIGKVALGYLVELSLVD